MESKKNKNIDYNRHRSLLLALGLLASTLLVSMTFNIRSSYQPEVFPKPDSVFDTYIPPIPITEFDQPKKPEPPKPKPPRAVVITEIPKVDIKRILQSIPEPPEDLGQAAPEEPALPVEPVVREFIVVEEQASFPGGDQAWMKYLKKNFKYPKRAKRAGIEGRVFLSFYVDAQGNLSDIEVIRGIGGGCDQEALRVLKNSPKWNPGKQRGIPVKSPMTLFITFRLK
ncbi:energy transducer TonB [Roseivirga sp. E12]|uniref:energy transducer TonB n=1 Tax=Roseivirga sp. E12 TaxID=2819237 RepID=UPI001ABC812F|nr:energy transducer TonB [Roseivirga sp. E12]MBO3700817.1 energy transducer TonB [Roseivirga sp. E12]